MPTYDYRCAGCGTEVEVSHPIGQDAPACGNCGGTLKKLFRAAAISFRGSGFHVNDYR